MITRTLASVAFTALLATSALATPAGNNGGGNGGCGVGQQTNGCGGGVVNPTTPTPTTNTFNPSNRNDFNPTNDNRFNPTNDNRFNPTNTNRNVNRNANTNTNRNVNTNRNRNTNTNTNTANANNSGNNQSLTNVNQREYRAAPGMAIGFSSGTCVPYGLLGSVPGAGFGFQFPDNSGVCPSLEIAKFLAQVGCTNAAIAIAVGGDRVRAVADNPCGAGAYRRGHVVRAKY